MSIEPEAHVGSSVHAPARLVHVFLHPTEGRLRAPWRGALLVLALVVAGVAFALLPFDGEGAWTAQLVMFVLLTLVAGRVLDRRVDWSRSLGFDRRAVLELALGTALGGGLVVGIAGLEIALGVSSFRAATDIDVPKLAGALVLFITIALSEELLFRAYLLTNLAEMLLRDPAEADPARRGRAVVLALLSSSLIFGLAHATNPNASLVAVVNVALAGLFLGLPFAATGRLGLGVGVHFGWNTMQSLLDMPVSGQRVGVALVERTGHGSDVLGGGAFGPEAGLLGLAAIGVGVLFVAGATRLVAGRLGVAPGLGLPPRPVSPHSSTRIGDGAETGSSASEAPSSAAPGAPQRSALPSPRTVADVPADVPPDDA